MAPHPTTFTIVPSGPFSLEAAAKFGFGGRLGAPEYDGTMRLAFTVDGNQEQAGVILRQDASGIHGEVFGARNTDAVKAQVARILSLDHDGEAWEAVGQRDPVIGELQKSHPGQRPVLFHSPYEAAAWSVISARVFQTQAAKVRQTISETHGETFDLDGQSMSAFPQPERLLETAEMPGLTAEKAERLRGIASAALEGQLDPPRLLAMDPDEATAEMLKLKGIGPFYAGLIVIRGTGFTDVLPTEEPRLLAYVAHFYGLDGPPTPAEFTTLAEPWRPFRTWASVLLRLAGGQAGIPHGGKRP